MALSGTFMSNPSCLLPASTTQLHHHTVLNSFLTNSDTQKTCFYHSHPSIYTPVALLTLTSCVRPSH